MLNEGLKYVLTEEFPSVVIAESGQYPTLTSDPETGHDLIKFLRDNGYVSYEKLDCISGVDWLTHMEVVYHLFSRSQNAEIVVKVKITDRENPATDSIADLWKGADLLECEIYDFFGIRFHNHPFLRRIFLNDDWAGYPLRKDYVDEINMITI